MRDITSLVPKLTEHLNNTSKTTRKVWLEIFAFLTQLIYRIFKKLGDRQILLVDGRMSFGRINIHENRLRDPFNQCLATFNTNIRIG